MWYVGSCIQLSSTLVYEAYSLKDLIITEKQQVMRGAQKVVIRSVFLSFYCIISPSPQVTLVIQSLFNSQHGTFTKVSSRTFQKKSQDQLPWTVIKLLVIWAGNRDIHLMSYEFETMKKKTPQTCKLVVYRQVKRLTLGNVMDFYDY